MIGDDYQFIGGATESDTLYSGKNIVYYKSRQEEKCDTNVGLTGKGKTLSKYVAQKNSSNSNVRRP